MTENLREAAQLTQRAPEAAPTGLERAIVRLEVSGRRDGQIMGYRILGEVPGLAEALRAAQYSADKRIYRHGSVAVIPWELYEALMDAAAPILQN